MSLALSIDFVLSQLRKMLKTLGSSSSNLTVLVRPQSQVSLQAVLKNLDSLQMRLFST